MNWVEKQKANRQPFARSDRHGGWCRVRHTQLAELLWEDGKSAAKNVAKARHPAALDGRNWH